MQAAKILGLIGLIVGISACQKKNDDKPQAATPPPPVVAPPVGPPPAVINGGPAVAPGLPAGVAYPGVFPGHPPPPQSFGHVECPYLNGDYRRKHQGDNRYSHVRYQRRMKKGQMIINLGAEVDHVIDGQVRHLRNHSANENMHYRAYCTQGELIIDYILNGQVIGFFKIREEKPKSNQPRGITVVKRLRYNGEDFNENKRFERFKGPQAYQQNGDFHSGPDSINHGQIGN